MKTLHVLLITCLFAFPFAARADDAEANKMIAEFSAKKPPQFDGSRESDPAYAKSYLEQQNAFEMRRREFGKEFYAKYPKHPQATEFLMIRWMALSSDGKADEVIAETDKLLADNPSDAQRADILFARGMTQLTSGDVAKTSAAAEEFIQAAPKDPRAPQILFRLSMMEPEAGKKTEITRRIAENYPDSEVGKLARGQLRQITDIGKPFKLSFTEAITQKKISMEDLKGKVVVIDFWATWCGPCVEDMPEMKRLYAQYKDRGIEFIGVSLDQPGDGLEKLKEFVDKNEIPWPQYYEGAVWNGEFTSSWGINSIPCVFIVDTAGNLHSTEARGQLDKLIPKLLAKGEY